MNEMSGVHTQTPTPLVVDEGWMRLDSAYSLMRHFEIAVYALVLLIPTALIALLVWGLNGFLAALVAIAMIAVIVDFFVQRRVKSWSFCEREDDLLVRKGVMVRRLSIVPYGRMQYVDVTVGPLERLFGLATVRLYTAAAATDARIPGLSTEEAARLRDQLATLGRAKAAGL